MFRCMCRQGLLALVSLGRPLVQNESTLPGRAPVVNSDQSFCYVLLLPCVRMVDERSPGGNAELFGLVGTSVPSRDK